MRSHLGRVHFVSSETWHIIWSTTARTLNSGTLRDPQERVPGNYGEEGGPDKERRLVVEDARQRTRGT